MIYSLKLLISTQNIWNTFYDEINSFKALNHIYTNTDELS